MDRFRNRLLAGSLGIILLIVIIAYSHTTPYQSILVLFSALTSVLALREYFQLAQHQGFHPHVMLGIICTITYALSVFMASLSHSYSTLPLFTLFIFFILFFIAFFKKGSHPLVNLAISLFGILYITIPLTFAIQINFLQMPTIDFDGRYALAYVLLVSKMTDIGAYFVGKAIGRTPLAPYASPKKTIEGAVGGLVTALLTGVVFHSFIPISIMKNLLLSSTISILAQFGDLAESILKRDTGVKDSYGIPGIGGMLDTVDSLVFTLPFMFLFIKLGLL